MDATRSSDATNENGGQGRTKTGAPGEEEHNERSSNMNAYPFRPAASQGSPRGAATSALVRDAARLRSVMVQAGGNGEERNRSFTSPVASAIDGGEREERYRERGDLARTIDAPPLPDLATDRFPVSGVMGGDMNRDTGVRTTLNRRPTMLRPPQERKEPTSSIRLDPASAATFDPNARGATQLRPIAFLGVQREPAAAHDAASPASEPVPPSDTAPTMLRPEYDAREGSAIAEPDPHADAHVHSPGPREDGGERETIRISADDPFAAYERPARRRSEGLGRGMLTLVMIGLGTGIGLALYAGGGDLLSSLFSNESEGVAVQSPSAVTERPQATPPPATAIDGSTDTTMGVAADSPDRVTPPSELRAEPSLPAPTPVAAANAESEVRRTKPAVTAAKPDSAARARSTRKPDAPSLADGENSEKRSNETGREKERAKEESDGGTGKYLVQVRATPDEAEAKLIAKRLRAKGASGVTIVRSEKNGAPFYRVRFTSTGSDKANELATRAGYGNVWVIRQK